MENKRKILVAGGDAESSAKLAAALKTQDYTLVLAADAVAVMTMALRHKPDAVLLGARLPAGGALLALRRLRSSVHTASIPIVALTQPGPSKQALLAAGAEDCLDLPIDTADIVASLMERLSAGRTVVGAPGESLGRPMRLEALKETGMMDSEPDEALDIITRLAARLLGTPVALVSLVDDNRQFFKSQIGLPEPWSLRRQTPLSHSFCQWVVSSDQEVVVADARQHDVLRINGAVDDLGVVAYAGVPLSTMTGETIGSFCAIDSNARTWTSEELATLRDLGQLVDAYLAIHRARNKVDLSDRLMRGAAWASAKGFIGAARLIRRHGETAEDRATIVSIVERNGYQLSEITEPDQPAEAAA